MRNHFRTMTIGAVLLAALAATTAEAKDKHRGRGRPDERVVRCESVGGKHTYCRTGMYGRVTLAKQLSRTPCERYDTWGTDGDGGGIWVRDGCRADFVVREERGWGRHSRDRDRYDDRDRDRDGEDTVRCASKDWGYDHCSVPGGARQARVVRQLSDTKCVRGDNWDVDRRGIWVDRGCEAIFEVR